MTSSITITDYWTTRAEGYSDRTADELAGPRGAIWEKRLRDALHTAPDGLVADLGCGPGLFTLLAARTGRGALGIDLTPKMLQQARTNHRRFAPQSSVSFLAADVEHLPLSDHSVAAVVSRYVIWNLPHPEAALLEIKRVLKPSGVLYYVDGNHYRYLTDPRWAKLHAVQTPVYGNEARNGTKPFSPDWDSDRSASVRWTLKRRPPTTPTLLLNFPLRHTYDVFPPKSPHRCCALRRRTIPLGRG